MEQAPKIKFWTKESLYQNKRHQLLPWHHRPKKTENTFKWRKKHSLIISSDIIMVTLIHQQNANCALKSSLACRLGEKGYASLANFKIKITCGYTTIPVTWWDQQVQTFDFFLFLFRFRVKFVKLDELYTVSM